MGEETVAKTATSRKWKKRNFETADKNWDARKENINRRAKRNCGFLLDGNAAARAPT